MTDQDSLEAGYDSWLCVFQAPELISIIPRHFSSIQSDSIGLGDIRNPETSNSVWD